MASDGQRRDGWETLDAMENAFDTECLKMHALRQCASKERNGKIDMILGVSITVKQNVQ